MPDFRRSDPEPVPSASDRLRQLPPRTLPLVYFAVARLAFLGALLALALDPTMATAGFYHPRLAALVHLVTLGWLTCSIFASLYIVGPFALRIALPAGRADTLACALATLGVAGVVAGLWLNAPAAAGWSGLLFAAPAALLGWRTLAALWTAPVQRAVTWHIGLAFVNFFAAATLGVLLAFDRAVPFLPGSRLSHVVAHAHLAAVGWVGLMAVGVGYRLFPMVLPAAMPRGASLYASVVLLQAGTATLTVGLIGRLSAVMLAGAASIAAGFVAFIAHVRVMVANPRPAPAARPRPDYGAWQAMGALAFLALAVLVGLALAILPMTPFTLRLGAAYGALGLIGFFAQLVAGMEYRLLPYFSWYWAFANTGFVGPAPSPHAMPLPRLQQAAFVLWIVGVPLLALGMLAPSPSAVAVAAWLLWTAVLIGGIDAAAIVRHAFTPESS